MLPVPVVDVSLVLLQTPFEGIMKSVCMLDPPRVPLDLTACRRLATTQWSTVNHTSCRVLQRVICNLQPSGLALLARGLRIGKAKPVSSPEMSIRDLHWNCVRCLE